MLSKKDLLIYSLNIPKEYPFLHIISIFEKFVSLVGEINISFDLYILD